MVEIPQNEIKVLPRNLPNIGVCETQLPRDIIDNIWDLIEEAKKNPQDMKNELAGNIKSSLALDMQSPLLKNFVSYVLPTLIDTHIKSFGSPWRANSNPDGNNFNLEKLWVNFQRQHEFNPPHDHSDELSFVAYLKIPKEIKEEYDNYKGKSSGPGGISFIYGECNRQAITYQAHFPEEKDLFIFPAWLKHYVAPFKSDVERISVSGNITSSIPIKNLQPIEPKNEEK